ncbi:MAG: hypothetical protein CMO55_16955 [Verrucomicrobiales bacterium]|nr:hypothetical protein [Verrucomicrobiales bacterium]
MPTDILDQEIMTWGATHWTLRDAMSGTQIFGGTGSGKTSGSGQHLALKFLEAGLGGLVLTVKPDETETWRRYAAATKRADDLILLGPRINDSRPYSFNFLEYERKFVGEDTALFTENVVNLFTAVMEVSQRGEGAGIQNAGFWINAARQMLRNTVDLLLLTGESLTFSNAHEVITTAPTSIELARKMIAEKETASYCVTLLKELAALSSRHPRADDIGTVGNYWLHRFSNMGHEERSGVVSMFTTVADPFIRGILKPLFSASKEQPQARPELCREGKIILVDMPVKQYFELGQFSQVLYKLIWQRAMERSDFSGEESKPVFLWADEAQFFISSRDMLFQTTARSANVATVYLTQSLSNYHSIMPGEKGKAETDALLANLQTKIFHASSDTVTNVWAAELLGKEYQQITSRSTQSGTQGEGKTRNWGSWFWLGAGTDYSYSSTANTSEELRYRVMPSAFTQLKRGGKLSKLLVEAIICCTGAKENFGKVGFTQKRLAGIGPVPAYDSSSATAQSKKPPPLPKE